MKPAAAPPADPRHRLRCLVVEDHRDTADSIACLLRLWHCHAEIAYNAEIALKVIEEKGPFDVALIDLALPRIDGCALARTIRSQCHGAIKRLIAITGYADDAHREQSHDAGFDYYLVKPFDPEALHTLLRNLHMSDEAEQPTPFHETEQENHSELVTAAAG